MTIKHFIQTWLMVAVMLTGVGSNASICIDEHSGEWNWHEASHEEEHEAHASWNENHCHVLNSGFSITTSNVRPVFSEKISTAFTSPATIHWPEGTFIHVSLRQMAQDFRNFSADLSLLSSTVILI